MMISRNKDMGKIVIIIIKNVIDTLQDIFLYFTHYRTYNVYI